ncbi:SGNH/GDSL hydrolase family protein [Leucobacter sp. M11]|uniref:SGNH/GDSL hydrolase family protein n=1 Tax=Leucobacter sp. M11 TaxID=2993565 RepID=UPI002D7FDFE9|nr:SGNH/GDSL hydrolase family protein [Leucobacter sp. M11]MEB4616337.1 SGNH/GDSL hydrolase family protein [Leucobacter sp. M11]
MEHPWSRFVAIGDSLTEGIGDPSPDSPGGHRGWADRVAEELSAQSEGFAYANLAVRGKLIQQIIDEQLEHALDLRPDLISICAGGNDVIRPGSDADEVTAKLEGAIARLSASGATIMMLTSVDTGFSPVFRSIRGKVAIYNENVRKIAQKYDAIVVDLWAVEELQDSRYWSDDRLHYNPLGHQVLANAALNALNVPHELGAVDPGVVPVRTWRQARKEDLVWAKEHLMPWVIRRIKHQSSGDFVTAKRPEPVPVQPPTER